MCTRTVTDWYRYAAIAHIMINGAAEALTTEEIEKRGQRDAQPVRRLINLYLSEIMGSTGQ